MQLRVRELREEKGWNQTTLGYHAGLSPSQISQIENGKRNPTLDTLAGIATALGVGVGDLFPKVEAPPEQEDPERREQSPERVVEAMIQRLILELKEDTRRWEEMAFAGSRIGLAEYLKIITRRASIQSSLNALDNVSEALDVDVSDRRGSPLRRPQRDLQAAYNRWRAAWEGMVDSHCHVLQGDEHAKAHVLHGERDQPVKSHWLGDVA